jgi:hypothetical protein
VVSAPACRKVTIRSPGSVLGRSVTLLPKKLLFFSMLKVSRYYCVQKREDKSPISKIRGIGVYSMNKPGGSREVFITTANVVT